MDPLRILIAEDHPLFRKGMISLLASVPDFEVVGETTTGEEAVVRAAQLLPDVILMDLQMPEVNGIEATRRILQESPSIRVLVVTLFEDDDSVFMALRAGARGYVLKDADEEEMVLSIRAVGKGEAIFSPAIANPRAGLLRVLSPRRHPASGLPHAHRPRARDPEPYRTRTSQPFDRQATVFEHQDGRQLRLQHLHQAAGGRPCPGDHPRQGSGPGVEQADMAN
jgi:DNA-binding NarL/FixJ family response regulator